MLMSREEMNRERAIKEAKEKVADLFDIARERLEMGIKYNNIFERKSAPEINAYITEVSGIYAGMDKTQRTITINNYDGNSIILMPISDTTYSESVKTSGIKCGNRIYSIAVKAGDYPVYIPVIITLETEKEYFTMIKNLRGRALAIKAFYAMEKCKRDTIISQLNSRHHRRFEVAWDSFFNSAFEMILKYALTKETYSADTQRVIEMMMADPRPQEHKVEQRLRNLLNISVKCEGRKPIDIREVTKKLDKSIYKQDRAKSQVLDIISSIERTDKKGCNIAVIGSSGVGKTLVMNTIADVLNRPFETISLNGLSNPMELEGLDPEYAGSDVSTFVKKYVAHKTTHITIGMEGIDNMNRTSKEGDPMSILQDLLSGSLYDKFLQCWIPTEDTVFIYTASSTDDIPEEIKSRFDAIIRLDDYSLEDKVEIAKRFLIPKALECYKVDPEFICFEDEAVICIISRWCEDDGVHDLETNIERVVRSVIRNQNAGTSATITNGYVEKVLADIVAETPAIYVNRNRDLYQEPVLREIKKCLRSVKRKSQPGIDISVIEKDQQCLEYLLACKTETNTMLDEFDPHRLEEVLHKNLYGMNHVINEVTNIYYTAFLKGCCLNSNVALCGGYGTGKSTIAKLIADAIKYPYIRLSLNGIESANELRGFSKTWKDSRPGRIMEGYKECGSLKAVVLLDEIDKIKPELAFILIDLLDREFTDNFINVPVDLSQSIFIATANDWSKVPGVIRDRFIVVNVDGYSRSEKKQIVSNYIIPKIENSFAESGVTVSIDKDAEEHLLNEYARSFGVRDAEKAIQRICSEKLKNQAGAVDAMSVMISKEDVSKHLGKPPIPSGNFPSDACTPGISRALAVMDGGILGSSFAIETVLIDGDESLEITGMPMESTTDSVKVAISCIRKKYPDLLKGKHVHVHFGEGSVPKDGPSAGVALFMSILSAGINKPIFEKSPYDIAYTGELSLTGGVFAVGGVMEKLQEAQDSGCRKVFIPAQNYEHLDNNKLKELTCEVIPVSSISQVVSVVFPELGKCG